ncbi:SgcJ/EcaC family oxidoreductase [Larkinella sp. VNQ87]|uniref:SgcJ/EcaC family oxidoreductase n=1 Tax=Larkinella sp. VNQ87 TaxID=3400921 RepID=UPI003C0DCCE5
MRNRFIPKTALLLGSFMLYASRLVAQTPTDSVAIQTILQQENTAWNRGDAVAYAQPFAENGTFTNIVGLFFIGRKGFIERHEQIFNTVFKKTTLDQKLVSLRFIRPDAAVVETLTWITGISPAGPPPGTKLHTDGRLYTRLQQIMVKTGQKWEIVSYHNVDVKPGIPLPELR